MAYLANGHIDHKYARLRGWEVDNVEYVTKSFSNQRVIHPAIIAADDLLKVLMFLVWKTCGRMRIAGYQGRRLFFGFNCRPGSFWSASQRLPHYSLSATELFKVAERLFYEQFPREYVTGVFFGVDELKPLAELQLETVTNLERTQSLYQAVDAIEHKFGKNAIKPARMLGTEGIASHRIPFNSTKDMEQYLFNGEDLLDD